MKIEEQVLSIEQMQHLKELGVEVHDTALCWEKWSILTAENKWSEFYRVCFHDEDYKFSIPTLTLQEILDMLPEEVNYEGKRLFLFYDKADGTISYNAEDYDKNPTIRIAMFCDGETILQDVYNALCWVAEKGLLNKE